jgi:hypothetical protein
MKTSLLALLAISVIASGCSSLNINDPKTVLGVVRKGDGVYSIKGTAFIDPTRNAIEQCRIDGDKHLKVIENTFELGVISGKQHPVLVFRCE